MVTIHKSLSKLTTVMYLELELSKHDDRKLYYTFVWKFVTTPNGIFDALNKLQILSITNKKVKLEIGVFENQSKLVVL